MIRKIGNTHLRKQKSRRNRQKLLTDYLANSVSLTIEYLEQVDEGTLDEVIDSNWTPPVTREDRLVSIIDDAVMHSGQGIYTCRLVIGK